MTYDWAMLEAPLACLALIGLGFVCGAIATMLDCRCTGECRRPGKPGA